MNAKKIKSTFSTEGLMGTGGTHIDKASTKVCMALG